MDDISGRVLLFGNNARGEWGTTVCAGLPVRAFPVQHHCLHPVISIPMAVSFFAKRRAAASARKHSSESNTYGARVPRDRVCMRAKLQREKWRGRHFVPPGARGSHQIPRQCLPDLLPRLLSVPGLRLQSDSHVFGR